MFRALLILALVVMLTPSSFAQSPRGSVVFPARASSEAAAPSAVAGQSQSPDFLFGRPGASFGVRFQWLQARAESEVFEFVGDLLTLEQSDFNAPGVAVELGLPLASRVDALVGFDAGRSSTLSNYRDFVDDNGLEIEQTTSLTQVGITGGVSFAILPRGRAIGQFAWVPARVVPYVGVGGGFVWYRFLQEGDFVDFIDDSIFTARLESSGWTPAAYTMGGVDIKLSTRILATVEGRYQWAMAGMQGDFEDFDDIDLTGLRVTAGVRFLF